MYGGSYEDYSFLYLARQLGGKPIENLKTYCSDLSIIEGTLIWFICESYLEWAILIDSGNNEAVNNPCLYEPFIEDMIRFQQGYIDSFSALIRNILNSINIMKEEPIIRYSEFLKNREENDEQ